MKLKDLSLKLSQEEAKKHLIKLLQDAHAGELAAAYAYKGHAYSLFIKNKKEKEEILNIYDEEIHHREEIFVMLKELSAQPRFLRELLMKTVGAVIGFFCLFGGWFIPMYGAGKLESQNIEEYEVAARLAYLAGYFHFVEVLLDFAEKEWEHECYFRKKVNTHFLKDYFPKWEFISLKLEIRSKFEVFKNKLNRSVEGKEF